MAGKRQSDLTGMEFGTWKVVEYIGRSKYKCECLKCGEQREISGYFLKNGQIPQCYECNKETTNKGRIDLTNKRFGQWTVLEYAGNKKWKCRCDCGTVREVAGNDLRNGKSTGCGHSTNRFKEELAGKKFNEWTVVKYRSDLQKWECICSCGKIGYLSPYQLKGDLSKSCGHDTTGFKDLTGKKFNNLLVIEKDHSDSRETYWKCKCLLCGNIKVIDGYRIRSGIVTSCGCDSNKRRIETTLNRYGVKHVSQINTNRNREQLEAISTREKLKDYIERNFDSKPSTIILANKLGISRGTLKVHLMNFGLEDMVENNPQILSGYEKYLADNFPTEYRNDRTILNGKEIDLYYPDKKFAIEFNGNYWHSDLKKDNITYHQEKTLLAERKGIQLFHIFEYEWSDKRVQNIILSILRMKIYGDRNTVLYARNCEVAEIEASKAREFLEENHIQGYANSRVNIGMFYNKEIVGVITFNKPRFTDKYECELVRLAFKLDTIIVGGAEKMFKYFIEKYNVKNMISYCDISKFSGNIYKDLGFRPVGVTKPNYVWINLRNYNVLKRYQTTKAKLLEMGLGNESMTEDDIMSGIGYSKIYDCGNKVFIWQSNKE